MFQYALFCCYVIMLYIYIYIHVIMKSALPLITTAALEKLILFGSLVPEMCNRTTCAKVHQLPQSHCGDNLEGTLFS